MSDAHYKAFKKDLKKYNWLFRRKTSSLRGLCDFLYANRRNPAPMTFAQALGHCANQNDLRTYKYRGAIYRLVHVWGANRVYPPRLAVGPWIQPVRAQLDLQRTFACGDAFANCPRPAGGRQPPENWIGFAGCINRNERMNVMNRHDNHNGPFVQGGAAVAAGVGLNNVTWRSTNLRVQHDFVYNQYRAGICTSFAKASAYVLCSGPRAMAAHPRIEIVSYRNHVFVIVGRKGGYQNLNDYLLPSKREDWGSDWYIVDGWAGAMGHEVVYNKTQNYPYPGMLDPLRLIMEKEEFPG